MVFLFTALLGEVGRSDVEDGLAAGLSFLGQAVDRPRIAGQHAAGELRVGVELEVVLDHVLVLLGETGDAGADHIAAVGQSLVVAVELLLGNEMHGRVIV